MVVQQCCAMFHFYGAVDKAKFFYEKCKAERRRKEKQEFADNKDE
jgi:hypothetical protein